MRYEEKVCKIVQEEIRDCIKTSSAACFLQGNIPVNRLNGAIRSYAYSAKPEEVVALIDTTLLGGGERGIVLTYDKIYYKEMFMAPVVAHYYYDSLEAPDDVYFSGPYIERMLGRLSEVWQEYFLDSKKESKGSGLLDTLFSMGKEYIGNQINNKINNVLDEMINEAIAKSETYKETLKAVINVLMQGINIDSAVCDEEEFWEKSNILYTNALMFASIEEAEDIINNTETFMEDGEEFIDSICYIQQQIKEMETAVNELIATTPEINLEKINLEKRAKNYWKKINNIVDEAIDLEEYDSQTIELIQEVTKEFIVFLKKYNRQLNRIIEYFDECTID